LAGVMEFDLKKADREAMGPGNLERPNFYKSNRCFFQNYLDSRRAISSNLLRERA
jgi:hypothetical protein